MDTIINIDLLRRLRRNRKLKIIDVARIVGRTRTSMWRYENGQTTIPTEVLVKLADFYGVSVDDLLWREVEKP